MHKQERNLLETFSETSKRWTSHYEGLAVPHILAKSIGSLAGLASVSTEIISESYGVVSDYANELKDACAQNVNHYEINENSMTFREKSIREIAMASDALGLKSYLSKRKHK